MESQKFELELSMGANGIVCNAKALLEALPTYLKSYSYIVSEENQKQAKEDRAKLNNLIALIKDQRMNFEKQEIGQWLKVKENLMQIEKTIKEVADNLGNGIKGIDEQAVAKKKENVRKSFEIYASSNNLDKRIKFEHLYNDKEFSKKVMTEEKILAKIQEKLNQIQKELGVIGTLLEDEDRVVLENYYYQTYDLAVAKAKYDDFKAQQTIQQQLRQQQQLREEELDIKAQQLRLEKLRQQQELSQSAPTQKTVQPTLDSVGKVQVVTATMEATNEYFVELFQLVNAHGVKMDISSIQVTLEAPTDFFGEIKRLKAKYNAKTQITSNKTKGE